MPLHSLYSDPDRPGEDKNFPVHSGWWPCQCAPRNVIDPAGQSGQWGRHPGKRASGFLSFCVGLRDCSRLSNQSFPLFPAGSSIPPNRGGCVGHARLCSFASGSLTPAAAAAPGAGAPPTGALPTGLCRDTVPPTQFESSRAALFIGDAERRKMSISGAIWAGGCLLRHSPILWCSFTFNILPFCVYFTGVYFG